MSRNATLNEARTVHLPRTLPVVTMDDLAPYHWVRNERGNLMLRKGARFGGVGGVQWPGIGPFELHDVRGEVAGVTVIDRF